ncbi:hypothetical protein CBER1_11668 [Cercospora berteroae]|uniref:Uncharacterized protein n=1 Tax=Cercospora berteroae TaxID=357750 RepID=A0A2S6C0A7_9PEZI|nr:hypothetical protein CBER1_11668 [Cercospora berteroae]
MALVSTRRRVDHRSTIRRLSGGIRKEARRQDTSSVLQKCPTTTSTTIIRITFDNINFGKWNKPVWAPHAFCLSTMEPLKSLPFLFEALVQQRSSKDVYLSQMLLNGQHILKLSSDIVQQGSCSNVVISLDEDPRVELLSDLFQDPTASELVLMARVKLTILENSQGSTLPDERIQHSRWHDVTEDYRILRIGSVPLRNGDEAEMAEKVCDHLREEIAYMQALTVWVNRKSGKFHLRRCHAFDFDDFCVGNAFEDTQWNQRAFSNRDYFLGRLENVQYRQGSKEDFVKLLEQLLDDEDEDAQMGSGIPFLPTNCYNGYQPTEHGLGLLSWPKRGIDVAATFVDKYDGISNLKFPQDIRIIVEEGDAFQDIIECLLQEINRQGREHGTYFNSARLFRSEHRAKWQVKLWIMPQTKQRKLYQYTSGDLLQFLSPALTIRQDDKRLYVEAQIIPADDV